jgi:hypothetical protein
MFGGYHPGANLRYAISATRTRSSTVGFGLALGTESFPALPPEKRRRVSATRASA